MVFESGIVKVNCRYRQIMGPISFTNAGIIVVILMTAVFFFVVNRLLSRIIEKPAIRITVSIVIALLLTALGIATSVYMQTP